MVPGDRGNGKCGQGVLRYTPSVDRTRVAWLVAIAADALQIVFFPVFGGGFLSVASDVLDFAVAVIMVSLLGWHVAFLPTVIAEVIPGFNLIPTWTAAVFFVTRTRKRATP